MDVHMKLNVQPFRLLVYPAEFPVTISLWERLHLNSTADLRCYNTHSDIKLNGVLQTSMFILGSPIFRTLTMCPHYSVLILVVISVYFVILIYYDTMYGTLGIPLVLVDHKCFIWEDHHTLRVYKWNRPVMFIQGRLCVFW